MSDADPISFEFADTEIANVGEEAPIDLEAEMDAVQTYNTTDAGTGSTGDVVGISSDTLQFKIHALKAGDATITITDAEGLETDLAISVDNAVYYLPTGASVEIEHPDLTISEVYASANSPVSFTRPSDHIGRITANDQGVAHLMIKLTSPETTALQYRHMTVYAGYESADDYPHDTLPLSASELTIGVNDYQDITILGGTPPYTVAGLFQSFTVERLDPADPITFAPTSDILLSSVGGDAQVSDTAGVAFRVHGLSQGATDMTITDANGQSANVTVTVTPQEIYLPLGTTHTYTNEGFTTIESVNGDGSTISAVKLDDQTVTLTAEDFGTTTISFETSNPQFTDAPAGQEYLTVHAGRKQPSDTYSCDTLPDPDSVDLINDWHLDTDGTDTKFNADGVVVDTAFGVIEGKCQEQAALFNGSTSMIVLPRAAEMPTSKTILTSFKYESNGQFQSIYKNWDWNPNKILSLHIGPDGTVYGSVGSSSSDSTLASQSQLVDGQIYQIAYVYEYGAAQHLYIDGVLDATQTTSVQINTNVPDYDPHIGASNYHGAYSQYFNSWIARLSKYNRALSVEEITTAYEQHEIRFTGQPGDALPGQPEAPSDPIEDDTGETDGGTTAPIFDCSVITEPDRADLQHEWILGANADDSGALGP